MTTCGDDVPGWQPAQRVADADGDRRRRRTAGSRTPQQPARSPHPYRLDDASVARVISRWEVTRDDFDQLSASKPCSGAAPAELGSTPIGHSTRDRPGVRGPPPPKSPALRVGVRSSHGGRYSAGVRPSARVSACCAAWVFDRWAWAVRQRVKRCEWLWSPMMWPSAGEAGGDVRVPVDAFSDLEERRPDSRPSQDVGDRRGVRLVRAVVEGHRDHLSAVSARSGRVRAAGNTATSSSTNRWPR